MKTLFPIVFFFFSTNVYSQTKTPKNVPNSYIAPVFFLDSVRVNGLGTFDNNKIEDINVVSGDSAFPSGRIYIKSKNPGDFNFLSAKDILKAYKISQKTSAIFMLDNEIIKDTTTFKIDSSFILNVEIINASEIEYLPNNISSLAILKVFTATKENIDKQKIIRIRRNTEAARN
jgi:hypothetical protein